MIYEMKVGHTLYTINPKLVAVMEHSGARTDITVGDRRINIFDRDAEHFKAITKLMDTDYSLDAPFDINKIWLRTQVQPEDSALHQINMRVAALQDLNERKYNQNLNDASD